MCKLVASGAGKIAICIVLGIQLTMIRSECKAFFITTNFFARNNIQAENDKKIVRFSENKLF